MTAAERGNAEALLDAEMKQPHRAWGGRVVPVEVAHDAITALVAERDAARSALVALLAHVVDVAQGYDDAPGDNPFLDKMNADIAAARAALEPRP